MSRKNAIISEHDRSIMAFLDEEKRISLSDDAKDELIRKSARKVRSYFIFSYYFLI